jgi:hypothetical protein
MPDIMVVSFLCTTYILFSLLYLSVFLSFIDLLIWTILFFHRPGCHQYGAEVLGFYRLWGDYQGQDYNKAYNIWTNPGLNPIPNEDVNGEKYWWNIRTLYEN